MEDLKKFKDYSYEDFLNNHYAVERLLELLVEAGSDIVFHILSKKEEDIPASYRSGFLRMGELKILNNELATRLGELAGMRNILVHGYEEIDNKIVYNSIKSTINDFEQFLIEIENIIF